MPQMLISAPELTRCSPLPTHLPPLCLSVLQATGPLHLGTRESSPPVYVKAPPYSCSGNSSLTLRKPKLVQVGVKIHGSRVKKDSFG